MFFTMSGSRTDIFTPKTTTNTTNATMNVTAAPANTENPNTEDGRTPRSRTTVPVVFKKALITEVKKHDIIWQDLKQKKNNDLLDDAWQKIRKALRIKKTGFCEKQWKLLCHGYRSHINRNTPMHIDLIKEMAFMAPQLKKGTSDNEPSDTETVEPEQPKNKADSKSPKSKKVARQEISENCENTEPSEDEKASVAILKLLFVKVPPESMRNVKRHLVETLIAILPDVEAKISENAKKQIAQCGNINNIDWSTLDVAAEVSKAVWDYKLMQMLLTA